jgi:hypothetical protein
MRRQEEVLRYTKDKVAPGTVARHYSAWRTANGIPDRCDEPSCQFHTQDLIWNGKQLKPILDHKNGNNSDNRPNNLRYLCANCDSQLPTRGGSNRGKVLKEEGGFALLRADGKQDFHLPIESGKLVLEGSHIVIKDRPTGSSSRTRKRRR